MTGRELEMFNQATERARKLIAALASYKWPDDPEPTPDQLAADRELRHWIEGVDHG